MSSGVPIGLRDDQPFEVRVAEAMAWCAMRSDTSDPRGSLRSELLRPSVLPGSREDAVCSLARQRRQEVGVEVKKRGTASLVPIGVAADLLGGRFLYSVPDETLWDGAAESESEGFFDIEDIPPWDTWLALYEEEHGWDVLVSWVPREYVPIAERGIRVSMTDNIGWLRDATYPFVDLFRSTRLI